MATTTTKKTTAKKPATAAKKPAAPKTLKSFNPATRELLGEVKIAGKKEVDAAVDAARAAQPRWAAVPLQRRIEFMKRVKRDLKFIFVDRMDEVLPVALLPEAATDPSRQPSTSQPN